MSKTILALAEIFWLSSVFVIFGVSSNIQKVEASETIYIRADGSVEGTDKIQRNANLYIFSGNIEGSIIVEKDNIVIDGKDYALQGIGIDLILRNNVTIRNMEIRHVDQACRVDVEFSSGCVISRNNILGDIILLRSSGITISENNITNGLRGIYVSFSSNTMISENNITNSTLGIFLEGEARDHTCHDNVIIGNSIANSEVGMDLRYSSDNILRHNSMTGNERNFGVWGAEFSEFVHDIDLSNTVDGKPVCYWINHYNEKVSSDCGYVALINSTNIDVQNLSLGNNHQGLLLVNTNTSMITCNNITHNDEGICLEYSFDNTVFQNNMLNNEQGIALSSLSSNNRISGNRIENSWFYGIRLSNLPSNNTISENDIASNREYAVVFESSGSNNRFYHNNFINHTRAVYLGDSSSSFWDSGYPSGGNYWNDYDGIDSDLDGIGDSWYEIGSNDIDHYPLMGMFSSSDTPLGFPVNVISNSTVEHLEYFESNSTIRVYVTGEKGCGFCRVCIPHKLMDVYNISVIVDDGMTPVLHLNSTLYDNGTHRWICFTYEHSTHKIDIVPELQSFVILPLFIIATLLAVTICKKKHI